MNWRERERERETKRNRIYTVHSVRQQQQQQCCQKNISHKLHKQMHSILGFVYYEMRCKRADLYTNMHKWVEIKCH
jgi:hypothetical protein